MLHNYVRLLSTILIALVGSEALYGQIKKPIHIVADIKGLPDSTQFFLNSESIPGLDSCTSYGGKLKFLYKGEPDFLSISTTKDNGSKAGETVIQFVPDSKNIYISGTVDSKVVHGSVLNDSLRHFANMIRPWSSKRDKVYQCPSLRVLMILKLNLIA